MPQLYQVEHLHQPDGWLSPGFLDVGDDGTIEMDDYDGAFARLPELAVRDFESHREEIARMADEAYLLCGGRMLASGEPEEIIVKAEEIMNEIN